MRVMFTLVLVLVMAAGVAYAQDLQNTLTQPAAGDSFVPDIVSTASSRSSVAGDVVSTLTEPMPQEASPPMQGAGIICAHVENTATEATGWVAPAPLIQPSGGWIGLLPVRQDEYRSMFITPEPGSFLVLAVGLGGLLTWRFRSRSR